MASSLVQEPASAWLFRGDSLGLLPWSLLVAALLALCAFVWRRGRVPHVSHRVNVALLGGTVLLSILVGEVALRARDRMLEGIPFLAPQGSGFDSDLGWRGREAFGDRDSSKFKILILGDSITYGAGVAEEDQYYNVLARGLDAERFMYAGGGYGTLQEYLALDRYVDAVRPDLVLLQVCTNDLVNNSLELERASRRNNNRMLRPYLIGGRVVYRVPTVLGPLRPFLSLHSRLFCLLATRLERAEANLAEGGVLPTVERDIETAGTAVAAFRRSVTVTATLVGLFRTRLGRTPLVAFVSDDLEPYLGQLRSVFDANAVPFIDTVPARIRLAGGANLTLDGRHWNAEGHRICGQTLAADLAPRLHWR